MAANVPEAKAFSSGPPDGRAGDPPSFMTCVEGCHSTFPLNSGDGSLMIMGLPTEYTPGTEYVLTIAIEDPDQSRWGFEMTVIDDNGDQSGDLATQDGTTQLSEGAGDARDYIKQTSSGSYQGQPDTADWEVSWTAPPAGSGPSSFYLAGNAANNAGGNSGDYIYSIDVSIDEASIGVEDAPLIASTILRAFPNPARSTGVTLQLDAPGAGPVSIGVFDAQGRAVKAFSEMVSGGGTFEFAVELGDVSPGRYWVRAVGSFGTQVLPLTILR